MVSSIDDKLDRMLRIMEGGLRKKATNGFIIKEMLINTILAGTVGYFLAKILDHHLHQHTS